MSSQVQRLLEAEKEAAKIVQEARQYRTQKLKDARTEAAKDIEQYRKQKEEEFKSLEGQASHPAHHYPHAFPFGFSISAVTHTINPQRAGNTSNAQDAVDKDTESKIAAIDQAYANQKDTVVQKLLDRVVLVTPELHRNLKKQEAVN